MNETVAKIPMRRKDIRRVSKLVARFSAHSTESMRLEGKFLGPQRTIWHLWRMAVIRRKMDEVAAAAQVAEKCPDGFIFSPCIDSGDPSRSYWEVIRR